MLRQSHNVSTGVSMVGFFLFGCLFDLVFCLFVFNSILQKTSGVSILYFW